jgi:hypothetical protein
METNCIYIFSCKEYSQMESKLCASGAEKTLPAQFWYFNYLFNLSFS